MGRSKEFTVDCQQTFQICIPVSSEDTLTCKFKSLETRRTGRQFVFLSHKSNLIVPSCAPDWYSQTPSNRSYNLYLFSLGFLLPLSLIIYSSAAALRAIRTVSLVLHFEIGRVQTGSDETIVLTNN